jgi:hypothetical protein
VLLLTWPDPPWDALLWGGIPVLVVFPILTYPVTKLLWLGFDLIFRPPTAKDFARPGPESPGSHRPDLPPSDAAFDGRGRAAQSERVMTTEMRFRPPAYEYSTRSAMPATRTTPRPPTGRSSTVLPSSGGRQEAKGS